MGAPRPRRDPAGPAGEHGHADPSFVEGPFAAPQGAAAPEIVGPAGGRRSVVGGEENDRIVGDAEFLQQLQDPADVSVQARNHRRQRRVRLLRPDQAVGSVSVHRQSGLLKRTAVLRVDFIVGNRVFGVGDGERDVTEERPILVGANELESPLRDDVMRIRAASIAFVVRQRQLPFVVVEVVRIEVMRVGLVQVADELVEALLPGNALGADVPESPFAEATRGVPACLEEFRHRHVAREKGHAARVRAD